VGHDTEAVRNLCTSALLLDGGRVIERGDPNTVVNKYYALISERERTYSEGHLIEHGEVWGEEYKGVYDFVQNLNKARIKNQPAIPVQEQVIQVNSAPRKVIFAHPPSEITYEVTLETGSSLAFAIGILPKAWDKISQGIKFDIDVIEGGENENIFSRVLQPKRNIGDRGWHNFILPLEKYAGKSISITFSTSGSGDDLSYCWAAWGWSKIIKTNIVSRGNYREIYSDNNSHDSEGEQSVNLSSPNNSEQIRYGNKKLEIIRVQLDSINGGENSIFKDGELASIKIFIKKNKNVTGMLTVGCNIKNKYSEIYGTNTRWEGCDIDIEKIYQDVVVELIIPLNLATGIYSITAAIACIHEDNSIEIFDRKEDCIFFRVQHNKQMVGFVDLDAKFVISINSK
jgi:hypothetical protein